MASAATSPVDAEGEDLYLIFGGASRRRTAGSDGRCSKAYGRASTFTESMSQYQS